MKKGDTISAMFGETKIKGLLIRVVTTFSDPKHIYIMGPLEALLEYNDSGSFQVFEEDIKSCRMILTEKVKNNV